MDMKTMRVMNLACTALMAILLMSCNNMDEFPAENEKNESQFLKIKAEPAGWNRDTSTRATYETHTLTDNINFPMTFTEGDAIGLFAVDRNGKVKLANVKYTYDGSGWISDTPIENNMETLFRTYFAYYPWKDNSIGLPEVNDEPDELTAEGFFHDLIAAWTPANDQHLLTDFTISDLMVAKGVMNIYMNIDFALEHKMGLLVTKPVLSYYNVNDPSDTWTVNQNFTTYIPYSIGDYRYFIAKPGSVITLGSKTTSVTSGQAEQLYFTNGEPGEH